VEVHVVGEHPTVAFAASELARYLGRVTGRKVRVGPALSDDAAGLRVGVASAFPEVSPPEVADPRLDDAVVIEVAGDKGVIAGGNPRSVLLAVYRYLTELGCRWVRPGPDGEYLPRLEALPAVQVAEAASYRHRAVCIEGAVSVDHVRDMVDWLPKLGFNGYFIQFREAFEFFNRWYARVGHPDGPGEDLSQAQAQEYTAAVEAEIAKRDLLYHKVGHGWTCEPFGIPGLGWGRQATEPGPEATQYFAEVNGERKLWGGVALNTNLCYSKPEVRRIMAEAIAAYAEEHPEVDYLHVWLADGSNNNCECAACRQARPSDFYVAMLNELDALLTQRGLGARIVFLIYVDLLWPPERETLSNTDRFVLMFAPIVRTYSETFRVGDDLPALPPFRRNELEFPSSVDANVAFLKAWQQGFPGDSFDFDYHLMWDHANDPGHMQIAETIAADMKGLRAIGLNGFVSCQVQRVFLPTGLAMTAMGRTLWNAALEFEDVARDYFQSAFGADADACRDYLTKLSELFDPPYLRGEKEGADAQAAEKLAEAPGVVESFRPIIERNMAAPDPCHAKSWRYLAHHAALTTGLAGALAAKARGDADEARALWQDVRQMAWEREAELHPVFDAWLFTSRLGARFE